jgi:hypothetical protein
MASKEKTLRVACVVMADGSIVWTNDDNASVSTAVKRWKDSLDPELFKEHQEENTGGGVILITMLARDWFEMEKHREGFHRD